LDSQKKNGETAIFVPDDNRKSIKQLRCKTSQDHSLPGKNNFQIKTGGVIE
jgi:hypothetical protein